MKRLICIATLLAWSSALAADGYLAISNNVMVTGPGGAGSDPNALTNNDSRAITLTNTANVFAGASFSVATQYVGTIVLTNVDGSFWTNLTATNLTGTISAGNLPALAVAYPAARTNNDLRQFSIDWNKTCIVFEGDSLTSNVKWDQQFTNYINTIGWSIPRATNAAVAGSVATDCISRFTNNVLPLKLGAGSNNIISLLVGANSVATTSGWLIYSNTMYYVTNCAQANGFKVAVWAITPRTNENSVSASNRINANYYLSLDTNLDYFIDSSRLMPNAADTNFYSDGIHQTIPRAANVLAFAFYSVLTKPPKSWMGWNSMSQPWQYQDGGVTLRSEYGSLISAFDATGMTNYLPGTIEFTNSSASSDWGRIVQNAFGYLSIKGVTGLLLGNNANGSYLQLDSGILKPGADAFTDLGQSNQRFAKVYGTNVWTVGLNVGSPSDTAAGGGNIVASNTITARMFIGDGNGLTNLASGIALTSPTIYGYLDAQTNSWTTNTAFPLGFTNLILLSGANTACGVTGIL